MRKMLCAAALAAALPLAAPIAGAQMPGPGRGPAVTFLLSHTGQLQLTDQEVVKLAAIARRAADRHRAMRASFDSLRMQFHGRADSGMRRREGPPPQWRAAMQKEHEANHADLRDALAVLTSDQQATAWELVSAHHMMHMRGHGHMDRMGPHRGGPGGPGMHMRTGSMQGDDDYDDAMLDEPSPDDGQ
jgi:hypothetical protein